MPDNDSHNAADNDRKEGDCGNGIGSTNMSPLLAKQQKFTRMLADLTWYAYAHGFALTVGEAWRTPEQAALNAEKGIGIKDSLHRIRLAQDYNLFRGDKYLSSTEDHRLLGEFWESLGGTWGGRFASPHQDGGHYSLAHEGRKVQREKASKAKTRSKPGSSARCKPVPRIPKRARS